MFDGEIVKKNPFLKHFGKFLEKTESKTRSKTKLGLENFYQFFLLQKALKCHVLWRNCGKKISFKNILDLENFWSKTRSKTKFD